ncbi:hypothetical protein Q4S45_19670 [Massilia sp. R2A-15]|uniref:hypothetical protein n=1 Tax=Massilia sp. R2A-15 TaxID=3064278 RepID=UPI002734589D|nr:hypothetical protein [Massilia sp. R2A-15]WLI88897.1 hypothetical protein Q4S45_19670 [Massilia sp. R2A-15]
MANVEHPDGEAGSPPVQDSPAGLSGKGAARRRFAKAGAGAAGVIATLGSRSAMAKQCLTPSAYCSGNVSHANYVTSGGLSPGYWKNHPRLWLSLTGINYSSNFSAFFPLSGNTSQLAACSCMDVLTPQKVPAGADPNNVAMHIMATLLNVRSKKITFLTEPQVKKIWTDYSFDRSWSPVPGKVWNGSEIVAYLSSTMD